MNSFVDLSMLLLAGAVVVFVIRRHWQAAARAVQSPSLQSSGSTGVEVANAVAARLERGDVLAYRHRDYCGMGLRFAENEYIYDEVSDGELPSSRELQSWLVKPSSHQRMVFSSRDEFVAWLANQTDESLSGKGVVSESLIENQRLTVARLVAFANGHQTPTRA